MFKNQKQDLTYDHSIERLQSIINNILDVIVEIDLNGNFTYISPQSLQMLGYEPKEVVSRKALRYVHPEDLETVISSMRKAIENDQQLSFEYRAKHKNGHYIYVSAKGGLINYNGERKITAVIRDISQNKIAKIKVKESEQQYSKIIESIGDPIQVIDNNLKIIIANSAFKEWINLFGITGEIFGKTPFELFPFLPKDVVDEYNYVFESGETLITEECINFKGNSIYTEVRKIPILTNGKVAQIITILRDITEKKKFDRYLEESEEKYRNLFENSPYMIFLVDLSGKILDLNQTAINNIIYNKEDLIGTNFSSLDIMRNENLNILREMFQKVLKNGFLDPSEFYINNQKIKLDWMKIQAKVVYIGDKKHIQVIIEDISEKKKAEKMLKDSENMYQNIIENTKDAIVIIDLDGRIQYVSPQLSILLKLKGKEITETSTFFKYIHEEDVQEIISFFKKAILEKSSQDKVLEFRILDNEKNYLWLTSTSKNYYDDEGNITGFITTLKDVTEKKSAEQKLKDSEVRYRLITENSNDLIHVLDKDFIMEFFNESAHLKVLGYSKEELLNKTDIFFNHPDDYREINRFMMKVFKTGEGFHESRLRHKNGEYIWFEVKVKCFRDEQEQQKYLLVYRDINERKKAEQHLKESEETYRSLYQKSPVAIVLTNDNGIILEQNQAAEKIFGYRADEVYGRNFQEFEVFDAEQIKIIKETYKELLKGYKTKSREFMIKKKDGTIAWINWQLSNIRQNELNFVETIAQDITEQKKAQLLIKKENEKLIELNKMKTELVSRASHELKTPLNSIYGGTQILLNLHKEEFSVGALEFIEMIHKGGARLKKLIDNLLDTSRIESNKLFLNIQKHNLSEIIKECVEEMMYLAGDREVEIIINLLNNVECEIDRLRIEQVITNLLSNAIKNTPSMGFVEVNLSTQGEHIYISVEDTGIGLTKEEMDKLFNKFGKIERYGKQLNVDIEGSGLGLFITKEIIDLHKGSIWVESEGKDKGSKFTVKLNKCYQLS